MTIRLGRFANLSWDHISMSGSTFCRIKNKLVDDWLVDWLRLFFVWCYTNPTWSSIDIYQLIMRIEIDRIHPVSNEMTIKVVDPKFDNKRWVSYLSQVFVCRRIRLSDSHHFRFASFMYSNARQSWTPVCHERSSFCFFALIISSFSSSTSSRMSHGLLALF